MPPKRGRGAAIVAQRPKQPSKKNSSLQKRKKEAPPPPGFTQPVDAEAVADDPVVGTFVRLVNSVDDGDGRG
eukprot:COSAG06_NODE_18928_length_861_cov_1.633858_1_plen_72_part_00